jgi:hypothetical protein
MQGTYTEESGVRGGWRDEGCCCPNGEKIILEKNAAFYSPTVGLTFHQN